MLLKRRLNKLVKVLASSFLLLLIGCYPSQREDITNGVRVAQIAKIKGLDPAFSDDMYSQTEISRAYEGLLQYHYLKRPYVLIPNLAESMPEMSTDRKVYTFRLKKGVLFHDDPCFVETGGKGRELTASDVAYSFRRLADPKLVSSNWWMLDGKVVGLNEWHDLSSKSDSSDYKIGIEGFRVLDRYTLQVKLNRPSSQFLYFFAHPGSFIVPREAVEYYGKEFSAHAVGTGPFRLAEYNPNSRLVWLKNPTFRREVYPADGEPGDRESGLLEDAGRAVPFIDRVVVSIIEEAQPMWLNFMAGNLDTSTLPKDNFSQAVTQQKELTPELKARGMILHRYPEMDVTHFSFNMSDPLIGKNKSLRRAMSVIFDDGSFIELFYNGRAIPAQGPIPPGLMGYDPTFRNPYRQYDLQKAKQLMIKAGYPDGRGLPKIELLTLSDSTHRQYAEYVEKRFSLLGIRLKVSTYSWPEFNSAINRREGQIYSKLWQADYPDAENFFQLFYSKNVSPGPNDANYVSPEFDRLFETSQSVAEGPLRYALYKRMVELVVEDCPWIFNVHRLGYRITQPWLKNFKPHNFELNREKYYRIDEKLRKSLGR